MSIWQRLRAHLPGCNRPRFTRRGEVQVIIDTSGYCQARCSSCVWPELTPKRRQLTDAEFAVVLDRFRGFRFSEFGFNGINEPFVDATLLNKLQMLIDRRIPTRHLFVSSNWLIPKPAVIDRFAELIAQAVASDWIDWVSVNCTVSGLDQDSYDILQGGRNLSPHVVARYRHLDFDQAVSNVVRLISALHERLPQGGRFVVKPKAYGDAFGQAEYETFWLQRLVSIDSAWLSRHLEPVVNANFTTFARAPDYTPTGPQHCNAGWLDDKLVVGPDGSVGLCCLEGSYKYQFGSLLDRSLADIVTSRDFQNNLAVVRGTAEPPRDHLCRHCEFYVEKD